MKFICFLIAMPCMALVAATAVAGPSDGSPCIVPATVTVPVCDAVAEHSTCHTVHARAHRPLARLVAAPFKLIARTVQVVRNVRHNAIERRQARRAHRRVFGPLLRCR